MFKNVFRTVMFLAIFAVGQAQGASLPEVVASARKGAADAFSSLAYYKFQNTPLTSDEIYWLVLYRSDLANDASSVKHSWNVGNYQQCAWTRVEKGAAIEFSQNQCESIIFTPQQAVPVLIQMSLLHYGVSEERSYVMSQVILSLAGNAPMPVPPQQPNPVMDVFNPAICAGAEISSAEMVSYFVPGDVYATPEFKAREHTRQRTCNLLTGCTPWVVKEIDLPSTRNEAAFYPKLFINTSGQATYKFYASAYRYENYFYFSVDNNSELGLDAMYTGTIAQAKLTNKCGYSKTYFATPKSNKGSFVEFEIVFYGLLAAPKK